MTERRGKFTRGPCKAIDGTCFYRPKPGQLRSVPIVSPIRTRNEEARANAELYAAAHNAATAAEDMGYDGLVAVEKLPKLLEMLAVAVMLLGGNRSARDNNNFAAEIDEALASCRAKELTP